VPTETARLNDVEHLSDIQKEQQGANDRALWNTAYSFS